MSAGLLDVNMLIALAWPSHVHHRSAHEWFARNAIHGWATCPMTQCGFVRISANQKIIPDAVSPREALTLLERIVSHKHHAFWSDEVPFLDECVPSSFLVGHRQITDAYLLGLAIRCKGRLVTFDKAILSLLPVGSPLRNSVTVVDARP